MSKKELTKRYILFIISLFFSALGVAITKKGNLGVSPISSVANVLSIKFSVMSLGNWLIIWNCVLLLGQIVILRKKFHLIQLIQIPMSFLFGWFTDLGSLIVSFIGTELYIMRICMIFLGTLVLAFGISLAVVANVVMNSGEAFVKAIADVTGRQFGNIKIMFDISCVVTAIVLSLIFFNMKIEGTREGTIIAAVFTGIAVKMYLKFLSKPVDALLKR